MTKETLWQFLFDVLLSQVNELFKIPSLARFLPLSPLTAYLILMFLMCLPISSVTLPICRASSYVGARHRHWKLGHFLWRFSNFFFFFASDFFLTAELVFFHHRLAMQTGSTWGWSRFGSHRLSIVRTKAAVFPVPLCDWAIMFCGLKWETFNRKHFGVAVLFQKVVLFNNNWKGKTCVRGVSQKLQQWAHGEGKVPCSRKRKDGICLRVS